MPSRHLFRGEGHHVGGEAHRGPRREHVLLLRLVLLEDVVLKRPSECRAWGSCLVRDHDVHGEEDGRCGVDRHGRGHRRKVDLREQPSHVLDRVDGHASATDLSSSQRVIGIEAEQGGHVERGGEPCAAVGEELAEALVGVRSGTEAGELAHRPHLRPVHGSEGPAREGELAGELAIRGAVDRLELDAGHRGEAILAQSGGCVVGVVLVPARHLGPPPCRASS